MTILTPTLRYSFTINVNLGKPIELGNGRAGQRRIIPIVGGTVTGPDLSGEVLNIGADWQTVFNDGAAHLDTRYALKTDDGATIEVVNVGTRHGPPEVMAKLAAGEDVDPASYYMRTAARLETGDTQYTWVNHTLFISTGSRKKSAVVVSFYRVE